MREAVCLIFNLSGYPYGAREALGEDYKRKRGRERERSLQGRRKDRELKRGARNGMRKGKRRKMEIGRSKE